MILKKRLFCSLALAFALSTNSVLAEAQGFVPHRAVYEFKFDRSEAQSSIVGGQGKWVLELNGSACTGFNVSYRFVTKIAHTDGSETLTDTRGKNFESGEGEAFDFANSTFRDNKLVEDVKGVASRHDDGLTVTLAKPEAADIDLDPEVLFPVQHYIKLVSKAKAGETLTTTKVFEGNEGGKQVLDVSAVIGAEDKSVSAPDAPYHILDKQKVRRWPVSLSYFSSSEQQDATPAWQSSFLLYENGVSRQLTFDYGIFVMKGTLKSLEFLPEEDCS